MTVKCKNLTNAIRASKALAKNNINCSVIKLTDEKSGGGCIHAITFSDEQTNRALHIMNLNGVKLHSKENLKYGGE